MPATNQCPECGAAVPPDAPRGLCPKCLMEAAASASATAAHVPKPPREAPRPPAEPAIDLDAYLQAVRELDLVPPQDLDPLAAAAQGDAKRLATLLARAAKLTPYQAGAILQGKARGLAIGEHLVLSKLGEGGMGLVFKARHRPSGREVALKMLPPSFGREPDAVRRFHREFEVASRLSHPNIVAAIEASEDRGVQFLTMDFIEGYDLEKLVERGGPMDLKLALHCVIQAARGLEAAHAQGIVHRDVKPGNIMIDPAGAVRVLDLGLARVIEATSQVGRSAGGSLTRTGAYMGTVDFLAPEQADNAKRADHRADIYSLGCTLYYLLTARPPFDGDTLLKRLMAHQSQPAPSLRTDRPEVPAPLEAVYQRMMAKRPADRPRSMSEVILALEACRASAREAGDVSADLKTFARTVMKRALPRHKVRDTSVFARSRQKSGLQFDPDLKLEDLVGDYREESGHEEIPEEMLPPRPYVAPPRRSRRRQGAPGGTVMTALALSILAVAAYVLSPRPKPQEPAATPPPTTPAPPSSPAAPGPVATPAPAADGFVPLFNGENLSGWTVEDHNGTDGWSVEDGAIVARGGPIDEEPHEYWNTRNWLLTDREYGDFEARFEVALDHESAGGLVFRAEPGEKLEFADGSIRQNHPMIFLSRGWGEAVNNSFRTGDACFAASTYDQVAIPADLKPAGEWDRVRVEVRGRSLRVWINDELVNKVEADPGDRLKDGSIPGLLRASGRFGLHKHVGTVRYRNIQIRELAPAPPDAPSVATKTSADDDADAPILYADDFKTKKNTWPQSKSPKNDPSAHGYAEGIWYCEARKSGNQYTWMLPGFAYWAFEAEIRTRVVGASPASRGSTTIHMFAEEPTRKAAKQPRAMQVRIDTLGRLFVEPSFWTARAFPDGPWVGPISHPAIRPGGEWNDLRIRARNRRIQIEANGKVVCDIDDFDWDLLPIGFNLGVASVTGPVRAEFDRMIVRKQDTDLGPLAPPLRRAPSIETTPATRPPAS